MKFFLISMALHSLGFVSMLSWRYSEPSASASIQIDYRKFDLEASKSSVKSRPKTSSATTKSASGDGGAMAVEGVDLGIHASYPRLSRVLGETGKVLITLKKGEEPQVQSSSGSARLDRSALSAIQSAMGNSLLEKAFERQNPLLISFIFRLKEGSDVQNH